MKYLDKHYEYICNRKNYKTNKERRSNTNKYNNIYCTKIQIKFPFWRGGGGGQGEGVTGSLRLRKNK